MRSSGISLRLLLSLLVFLASSVYIVTADDTATPKKTAPGQESDVDEKTGAHAGDEHSTGGKSKPNGGADAKVPPVTSQIIQQAPQVELLNNGDIDPEGDCKKDVDVFCQKVKAGSSHLAECLQNRIEDEEDGDTELSGTVSKKCKEVVINYKMKLATNINYDTAMAQACKKDAEELCADLDDVQADGKIITCLRERKPELTTRCRDHITRAQLEAAKDYRIDAEVYDFCRIDSYKFCKGVEAGSGRVNACLREHRDEVQYECRAALFRMDMENADDIRLNTVLFKACLNDKRKFCPDVFPGNGRAEICLEENMNKPGFTEKCKEALEDRIERMSRDYRLDPVIRRSCKPQVQKFCEGPDESLQGTLDTQGTVMECLKRHHEDLKPKACKDAVGRAIQRSSQNVRFASRIAASCQDDRKQLCTGLRPGDARIIRCLAEARENLSQECRSDLFAHELMISESIDFNFPLQQACLDEVDDHCDGIPHGDARIIRCLQDGNRKQYSKKCLKELTAVEKKMGEDFRLNHRLETACESDSKSLCDGVCEGMVEFRPCGGKVLQCLIEKKSDVKSRSCKKEVDYYIKMEVNTFGNDVILAEACRGDVDSFCSEVAPGDGRVHECLRKRRSQLSERCAKEELKLEIQESKNFDLRPNLKKVCVQERNIFCSEVRSGSARVFRCLAHNLAKADFGEACRNEIKAKLMRRQQNWKLDVSLRNTCKGDAALYCSDVDHDADKAEVMHCLVAKHANLTDACAHEVSRATYMALNVYQEEGPITQVCADDADACMDILGEKMVRTGAVLTCLEGMQKGASRNSTNSKHMLEPGCAKLLSVAKPPDEHKEFESNLKAIASQNVKKKLATVGMWDNRKGVTITGYTALACFSALCTSVAMALIHLYKRWRGIRDDGYVQVVKRGDL